MKFPEQCVVLPIDLSLIPCPQYFKESFNKSTMVKEKV